jgi:hypothetical protein
LFELSVLLLLLLLLLAGWFAGAAFCHGLLLAAAELLSLEFCWADCCWVWNWDCA